MEPRFIQFDIDSVRDRFPAGIGDFLGRLFENIFYWLQVVSLFLSLFLLIGIIYATVRINQIRKLEREELSKLSGGSVSSNNISAEDPLEVNPRWEHIKKLMESDSENDWRLAILEADIMLSDMVDRMQYPGETLGEKLKNIEKSDFNTIENAWEAHKIRNQIAHEGSNMNLSEREARRAIALFESAFAEFHYI